MSEIRLHESWKRALNDEFEKPYFQELSKFVKDEILAGKTVYPHPRNIFAALDTTPFDKVSVVILGQDPYHGPGQAHGLCFSVQAGVRNPPSLQNIFKEIELERKMSLLPPSGRGVDATADGGILGINKSSVPPLAGQLLQKGAHGDLTRWAEQGVLLLNTTLTVLAGQPMSHAGKGWEVFTDTIIETLSKERDFLVFLLWGNHAQKKKALIDFEKHAILEAPHPSPLSAHRGFLGCNHFALANELLLKHGKNAIMW